MMRWLRRALFENLSLKLISLTLAVFLFVFVRAEKQSLSNGAITVSFTPPPGKILVDPPPTTLRVSVSGPASRMQRFRFEDLNDLHVDLRRVQEGYFKFRDDLFDLPPDLKVVSIRPAGFMVRYEPLATRTVPVKVTVQGQVAQGRRIASSRATPASVRIQGPKSTVLAIGEVETQPVLVDGATSSFTRRVSLASLPKQVRAISSTSFKAEVEIEAASSEATLSDVRVVVKDPTGRRATLSVESVRATVSGPAQLLANLLKERVFAEIRVSYAESGVLKRRPVIRGLPEGVRVLRVEPPEIEVSVEAAPAPPAAPAQKP